MSTQLFNDPQAIINVLPKKLVEKCTLWHYRLWSFKTRDTKLERFLHKNQHTQRKLLNFENWTNGEQGIPIVTLYSY
jgi:hypothetical protein